MGRWVRLARRAAAVSTLAAVTTLAVAVPAQAYDNDTFADVTCVGSGPGTPKSTLSKGWGVDYQPNYHIEVWRYLYLNNTLVYSDSPGLWTNGTGSWWTSTLNYSLGSILHGTVKFNVYVTSYDGEHYLGADNDTCSF